MSRRPFDLFRVAHVAEFPDPRGETYIERLDGSQGEGWEDEAIATFFTVYGRRNFPEEGPCDDCGDRAIYDTDDLVEAVNLAYALADGKPVELDGLE